jgi:hypothetical protein
MNTNSDTVKCDKCNKAFAYRKYLLKHLRRKTPCTVNSTQEEKTDTSEKTEESINQEKKDDPIKEKKDDPIKEENNNFPKLPISDEENDTNNDLDFLINTFSKSIAIVPDKNKNILRIQSWFRTICNKSRTKCKIIIDILTLHPTIMSKYLIEILSISKKFPPRKNENKFIYGKLIEKSLLNAFVDIGFNCEDLDKSHASGSEYKNDIKMLRLKYSIKAQMSKGDVRLINTLSTAKHTINMTLILCVINDRKLYIFPSNIVNQQLYIKKDAGSISYKASLFSWIDKHHPEYIYKFPDLTSEQDIEIQNTQEIMIYDYLYSTFIKNIQNI